ncbi:hypothetical protein Bca4012_078042 [Brassica carinata]
MSPLEISTNSSPTLMSRPKKQSSSARLECLRYRVELSVDDGNDNATFVVFDREMLNLIKKDAATLTVEETFNTKEASIVGGESGETSASAGTLVEGEAYDPNQTGGQVKDGNRKRLRE